MSQRECLYVVALAQMPRFARLVVPGYPHHVTQRGARRQTTFFSEGDYGYYIRLLSKECDRAAVQVWAYCLMPNHVHFVVVPAHVGSLAALFRATHQRYTYMINEREEWRGHLWQERFYSSVLDEAHLLASVRYVELNPVRAKLCRRPEEWRWSSVHAHLNARNDSLVSVAPMLSRVDDWTSYLRAPDSQAQLDAIRTHARSGRPIGEPTFIAHLENLTQRRLQKRTPGRKRK